MTRQESKQLGFPLGSPFSLGAAVADILDIVDENDVVIGSAPSEEVHSRGLLHRFVHVFVVGSDGRILVQQRHHTKKRGALLFDAAVGGHVDSGETYAEAAVREGREEIGLVGVEFEYVGKITNHDPPVEDMLGELYVVRSDGPFAGWEREAERLEWMEPGELAFMLDRFPYLFTKAMPESFRLWRARRT